MKPRFILTVGAYFEEFPDVPADLGTTIYDRAHKQVAVTISPEYGQMICLETTNHGAPFTAMVDWMNGLSDDDLASENLPTSKL